MASLQSGISYGLMDSPQDELRVLELDSSWQRPEKAKKSGFEGAGMHEVV
jgi:hypothetical protein